MSYIVTKTDGTVLTTIIDGTKDDTSSSLTLIGRNYSNYGQFVANDFVRLLENFSYETAPLYPINGQIWWKRDSNRLQVYTGSAWKVIGNATSTPIAPTTTTAGDIWWDSSNQQLYIYNGTTPYATTGWQLVGPTYSAVYGKSGAVWESIEDSLSNTHHVVSIYLDSVRTGIISSDSIFTPNVAIPGFTTIQPGHNIQSNDTFWGTANNSNLLGNQLPSKYFRNDIDNITNGNIIIANDNGLRVGTTQQLRLTLSSVDASITNTALNGDINLYVNVGGISTKVIYVEGTTGVIEVAADPTTDLGISTKQYVDAKLVHSVLTGNPIAPTPAAGDNDTSIATTAFVFNANAATRAYIDSINVLKANIASPVFTGNPLAPTPAAGDNDTSIATTAFVFNANAAMRAHVDLVDWSKANIASPIFTGTPRSVTPAAGDNDANIATTAFVFNANAIMRAHVDAATSSTTGSLILKANIASPIFTGTPHSVTPSAGDSDTKIATTEFVQSANIALKGYVDYYDALKANIASPIFTGTPQSVTPAAGDNDANIATTAFVFNANAIMRAHVDAVTSSTTGSTILKANIASPIFTGTPRSVTPSAGDSDTKIATTEFVQSANIALKGYVDYYDALKANIASPALTGVPISPTMPAGTANTSIATTAFVFNANAIMRAHVDAATSSTTGSTILKANIASPTLTGVPLSPTMPAGTANTSIATTSFVSSANVAMKGYVDALISGTGDGLTGKANIASPTLTGVPLSPTMPAGTANTSIATTAFVINNSGFLSNKIYQGDSYLQITDAGTGQAVLYVDGVLALSATSSGVNLKQGSTAYTQAQSTVDSTIATTSYVQTATLKWAGSTKYVSTSLPSGGVDGDIWFRYS